MSGGLIGDGIRLVSRVRSRAVNEIRINFGCVSEQTHRYCPAISMRIFNKMKSIFHRVCPGVEVTCFESEFNRRSITLDGDHGETTHGGREGLGAAHAAETCCQDPSTFCRSAEMLARHFGEGFEGALNDALGADIYPRAGSHLTVHHQSTLIEFREVL